MGKIYLNQTALRINVNTGINLESADSVILKVKKPNATTVEEWECNISDSDNGMVYHDIVEGDLDIKDSYTVWAYAAFSDGSFAPGDPFTIIIHSENE